MAFKDVSADLIRGLKPKRLPYKRKTYEFPTTVSAATGIVMQRIQDQAGNAAQAGQDAPDMGEDIFEGLSDDQRGAILGEIMGDAEKELIKDEVPLVVVEHMRDTLIIWHMFGQEAAEQYWADVDGAPKAPADHKHKTSSKSTAKRTSAAAKSTRSQGSTTRTNRRK